MREWYEFNRDAVRSIIEKPIESIVGFIFIVGIFYLTYVSLWIVCPCG